MSAAKNLSNDLQAIVDNRLDAIDQNLLRAGLPRHQRRAVVEEVENQILEMLSRLEVTEYTRADVLAVLAKLDPPEQSPPDEPGAGLWIETHRRRRGLALMPGSRRLFIHTVFVAASISRSPWTSGTLSISCLALANARPSAMRRRDATSVHLARRGVRADGAPVVAVCLSGRVGARVPVKES